MKNFIPKPYKKEPVTVRINVETLELIDRISLQYNLNRSEFINRCIEYAIAHMDLSPELTQE